MKRYVCLLTCLLLAMMSIPVVALPEEDGFTHYDVLMDYVVDTASQTVVVGLKDENGGSVNGYVYLEVDGEQIGEGVNATGSDTRVAGATAEISYSQTPSTASSVFIVSKSYSWGTVMFEEARQDVTAEVFASLGYETTVATTTQTTAVEQTDATVNEPETTPTTAVGQNNRELLRIDVDPLFAEKFGYTEAELESRIKAYVNREDYLFYVGESAATLHLLISYDEQCSEDQTCFINAKNADSKYAAYADEEIQGMAFKIDLVFTDENGEAEYLDMVDMNYDMEMVIPASMQKTKELTFALVEEDGQLSELKAAYPSNGAIVLTLSTFQSFAVMSFGTQTEMTVQTPTVMEAMLNVFNTWQTALAFVGGVLLFVGGIVLIIIIAKKKSSFTPEEGNEAEEIALLDEEVCKSPVPSRRTTGEEPVKTHQKRPLDEAIPVIHRVEGNEPIDPEAFGRLSEQSVTPAKISPYSRTVTENKTAQNTQNVPTVDDLLNELSEDLENLKKQ